MKEENEWIKEERRMARERHFTYERC